MSEKAIYFDSSKCTACKGCQVACKCWNNLPSSLDMNAGEFTGSLQNPPDLEGNTRVIITFDEKARDDGYGVDWAFGRRACMHCSDPACVDACPANCLRIDSDTSMVTYDPDDCIGCQYCRQACPYDVPRHDNVGLSGAGVKINKCTGCVDRIKQGMKPACVTTCQPGALQFGDRDEMLEMAEARVKVLKKKGFEDARVYGKTESGGTHVIYVLKYPLSQYELPEDPEEGVFNKIFDIAKPLAAVAAVGIVGGLGISYLTGLGYKRDEMRYDEVNHDVIDVETGEVVKHIDKEAGER